MSNEITKERIHMTDQEYLDALERLKVLLDSGLPLHYEDSNVTGDKYNRCTWGLCSEVREMWPKPEMHLWPDQFVSRGRIAPLYRQQHHLCPLDTRSEGTGNGCFWTCRVFQHRKHSRERKMVINVHSDAFRAEYMECLDKRIAEAKARIASGEAGEHDVR